jgi:hypothetical protein
VNAVSINDFLTGFAREWYRVIAANALPPRGPYGDRDAWKEFVEGERGLIARVLCTLQPDLRYCREALFRFDGACAIGDSERYPVTFAALIEHELGTRPEEEMQKLILSRAPLKILIFYDWGEHEKDSAFRRQWVESKLAWFASSLRKANGMCPENPQASYLFLIGKHSVPSNKVEWFHASNWSLQPMPLARCD